MHKPVMIREVLEFLAPREGGVYVDATFGAGGYSEAILQAADCTVYAIDRDRTVEDSAARLKAKYGRKFEILYGNFAMLESMLKERGVEEVNGFVFDLGVSSMQLDRAERGFSFMKDGPLDMRMGDSGKTAADFVNNAGEEELADIIYNYGEERDSRRIAREIVKARAEAAITRTVQLADIVRRAVRSKPGGIHPATRSFQAIRIWVNDELSSLKAALAGAVRMLAAKGRMVVVSFHSLEDRIVKSFFREEAGQKPAPSRYEPVLTWKTEEPRIFILTNRAVTPLEDEISENPRARSARLRAAEIIGGAYE